MTIEIVESCLMVFSKAIKGVYIVKYTFVLHKSSSKDTSKLFSQSLNCQISRRKKILNKGN